MFTKGERIFSPDSMLNDAEAEWWKITDGEMEKAQFLYKQAKANKKDHLISFKTAFHCLACIIIAGIAASIASYFGWRIESLNLKVSDLVYLSIALLGGGRVVWKAHNQDLLQISREHDYLDWMENLMKR